MSSFDPYRTTPDDVSDEDADPIDEIYPPRPPLWIGSDGDNPWLDREQEPPAKRGRKP